MVKVVITKVIFKDISKQRVKSELRVLKARIKLTRSQLVYECK